MPYERNNLTTEYTEYTEKYVLENSITFKDNPAISDHPFRVFSVFCGS